MRTRSLLTIGWLGSGALDVVSDAADAVKGAVQSVPGVEWLGDRAKDLGATPVGKAIATALGTAGYAAIAPIVGPQVASVAFAFPGLLQGDAFDKAWVSSFADRVQQTANIVGPQVSASVAAQLQPAIERLKASIPDSWEPLQSIAKRLGLREDVTEAALALLRHELPDPSKTFDPVTGVWTNPPPPPSGLRKQVVGTTGKPTVVVVSQAPSVVELLKASKANQERLGVSERGALPAPSSSSGVKVAAAVAVAGAIAFAAWKKGLFG